MSQSSLLRISLLCICAGVCVCLSSRFRPPSAIPHPHGLFCIIELQFSFSNWMYMQERETSVFQLGVAWSSRFSSSIFLSSSFMLTGLYPVRLLDCLFLFLFSNLVPTFVSHFQFFLWEATVQTAPYHSLSVPLLWMPNTTTGTFFSFTNGYYYSVIIIIIITLLSNLVLLFLLYFSSWSPLVGLFVCCSFSVCMCQSRYFYFLWQKFHTNPFNFFIPLSHFYTYQFACHLGCLGMCAYRSGTRRPFCKWP